MQDEQVQRIESRFDGLDSRFDALDSRFDGIDWRLDGVDSRFDRVESKLDVLDGRVGRLESKIENLGTRVDQVDRHMHVVHEDLIERIKALAPDLGPIGREFRREIADLRESTDRRLIPLETAERMRRRPKK